MAFRNNGDLTTKAITHCVIAFVVPSDKNKFTPKVNQD